MVGSLLMLLYSYGVVCPLCDIKMLTLFSSPDTLCRDWIKAHDFQPASVYDSLKCSVASDQAVRGHNHTLGLEACPSPLTLQLEALPGA